MPSKEKDKHKHKDKPKPTDSYGAPVKKNGLNIWHYKPETEPLDADFIAVQGLGSHPWWTWVYKQKKSLWMKAFCCMGHQESKETMWLKDLMPKLQVKTRVASFSYASGFRAAKSDTLEDYAELFLNVLLDHQNKNGKRPLVLLGHSLGGLVIQHAMIIAADYRDFAEIPKYVSGIIFLGVPFQGSSVARAGELIAGIARKDRGYLKLIDTLRRNGKELNNTLRRFSNKCRKMDIVCFYESKDTKFGLWKTQVVDVTSGTLIDKRRIKLDADHSGLNKFSGINDENFQLLCPQIERMVGNGHSVLAKRRRRNVDLLNTDEVEPHSTILLQNNIFVGQEDYLRRLDQCLPVDLGHRRAALVGEGGYGKTRLAIAFAIRLLRRYPRRWVFWVYAGSAETFEHSYRTIAEAAKIQGRMEPGANILVVVSTWLRDSRHPWLMIIDDVKNDVLRSHLQEPNNPGAANIPNGLAAEIRLNEYIPQSRNGMVLITTRKDYAPARLNIIDNATIPVNGMEEEDAVKLLRKQKLKKNDVEMLPEALDYSPLAITQAAAAISEYNLSVREYLNRLRQMRIVEPNANIAKLTGMLSFNLLEDLERRVREEREEKRRERERKSGRRQPESNNIGPNQGAPFSESPAKDLLYLMCFLDCHGISRSLLLGNDPLEFTKAMIRLKACRLVETHTSGEGFQMQSFIQEQTKVKLAESDEEEKFCGKALELVSEAFRPAEYQDRKSFDECQKLLPHVTAVLVSHQNRQSKPLPHAKLLVNASRFYYIVGQYPKAEGLATTARKVAERLPDVIRIELQQDVDRTRMDYILHAEMARNQERIIKDLTFVTKHILSIEEQMRSLRSNQTRKFDDLNPMFQDIFDRLDILNHGFGPSGDPPDNFEIRRVRNR